MPPLVPWPRSMIIAVLGEAACRPRPPSSTRPGPGSSTRRAARGTSAARASSPHPRTVSAVWDPTLLRGTSAPTCNTRERPHEGRPAPRVAVNAERSWGSDQSEWITSSAFRTVQRARAAPAYPAAPAPPPASPPAGRAPARHGSQAGPAASDPAACRRREPPISWSPCASSRPSLRRLGGLSGRRRGRCGRGWRPCCRGAQISSGSPVMGFVRPFIQPSRSSLSSRVRGSMLRQRCKCDPCTTFLCTTSFFESEKTQRELLGTYTPPSSSAAKPSGYASVLTSPSCGGLVVGPRLSSTYGWLCQNCPWNGATRLRLIL